MDETKTERDVEEALEWLVDRAGREVPCEMTDAGAERRAEKIRDRLREKIEEQNDLLRRELEMSKKAIKKTGDSRRWVRDRYSEVRRRYDALVGAVREVLGELEGHGKIAGAETPNGDCLKCEIRDRLSDALDGSEGEERPARDGDKVSRWPSAVGAQPLTQDDPDKRPSFRADEPEGDDLWECPVCYTVVGGDCASEKVFLCPNDDCPQTTVAKADTFRYQPTDEPVSGEGDKRTGPTCVECGSPSVLPYCVNCADDQPGEDAAGEDAVIEAVREEYGCWCSGEPHDYDCPMSIAEYLTDRPDPDGREGDGDG